jgi:hypothetical protein
MPGICLLIGLNGSAQIDPERTDLPEPGFDRARVGRDAALCTSLGG